MRRKHVWSALIDGVVVERSGCLFVEAHGDRWLLLWPEGASARIVDGVIEVLDEDGEVVAREGGPVRFGGGERNPLEMGGEAKAEASVTELTGRHPGAMRRPLLARLAVLAEGFYVSFVGQIRSAVQSSTQSRTTGMSTRW